MKQIDLRHSKDTFGLVTRGITTAQILLKKDSKNVKQIINELLPKDDNKTPLFLILRNIVASENIGTKTQIGYCYVEIEFAQQVETSLISLGTFYGIVSEKNNTVNTLTVKEL